jgi:2'-5' RNA ligase
MRLFVGLPVPAELARALARLAASIELPKERRTPPEDMHLTLAFLGETDESLLGPIKRELAALRFAPLQLKVTGLGTFPRPGVLFAELDPAPALLKLQVRVAEGMRRCGFAPDDRPYHPHLTLARFHGRLKREDQRAQRFSPCAGFRVEIVNLYCSKPSLSGARYEILSQKWAE